MQGVKGAVGKGPESWALKIRHIHLLLAHKYFQSQRAVGARWWRRSGIHWFGAGVGRRA